MEGCLFSFSKRGRTVSPGEQEDPEGVRRFGWSQSSAVGNQQAVATGGLTVDWQDIFKNPKKTIFDVAIKDNTLFKTLRHVAFGKDFNARSNQYFFELGFERNVLDQLNSLRSVSLGGVSKRLSSKSDSSPTGLHIRRYNLPDSTLYDRVDGNSKCQGT